MNWEDVLAAGNEQPPAHLRVNRRRAQRDDYLERLNSEGLEATALPHCPGGGAVEAASSGESDTGVC